MSHCPHPAGWTRAGGEARCGSCGTRRFADYAALRPSGLPAVVTPSAADGSAADRAAARNVMARQRPTAPGTVPAPPPPARGRPPGTAPTPPPRR
ncbi:DUF6255 family natural product biosynthesis protein [Streptomyces sp. NPDC026206]|uniref:DUF6255 family natural product biosynthesis protein n=1 Tax=Streptomyces sp. NPDC026206 TaxID=3157089 RepID=UPI0033C6208C